AAALKRTSDQLAGGKSMLLAQDNGVPVEETMQGSEPLGALHPGTGRDAQEGVQRLPDAAGQDAGALGAQEVLGVADDVLARPLAQLNIADPAGLAGAQVMGDGGDAEGMRIGQERGGSLRDGAQGIGDERGVIQRAAGGPAEESGEAAVA